MSPTPLHCHFLCPILWHMKLSSMPPSLLSLSVRTERAQALRADGATQLRRQPEGAGDCSEGDGGHARQAEAEGLHRESLGLLCSTYMYTQLSVCAAKHCLATPSSMFSNSCGLQCISHVSSLAVCTPCTCACLLNSGSREGCAWELSGAK